MAVAVGIDLGTTNSVIAATEGGQAHGDTERRGVTDDALGGGVHPAGRAPGRPARPAAGDLEPEGDDLFRQAVHRAALRRGDQRADRRVLRCRRRPGRRGAVQDPGPAVRAGGDLGAGAPQAGRRRGEIPRREDHRGGHHGAGVLQRRAAAGDQGRGPHRRPGGAADHQRAHRCGAGLRAGQEGQRDRAGLRPGRRHLRREHPGHRRRRGRGTRHRGRHPPGRRRLRPPHRRPPGRPVPARQRDRPAVRSAGAAAPVRGGREGQGRAVLGDPDHHQPAVHHRRRVRAQAPQHHADAVDVRADHRRPGRADHRPGPAGACPTPRSPRTTSTR